MIDNKINHFEEMFSHQEKQIQDLSEVVNNQWKEIDKLKQQLKKTNAKLEVLEDITETSEGEVLSVTEIAVRDKPPHY
ncbi:MAG: SlyX family protein [Alphaproteobacteria bacterium]|nr:SlyX family protein [Alphaproteobacteria bacterium]